MPRGSPTASVCGQQTVRDAIHEFNQRGLDALGARSSRPKRTREAFDQESAEALREMLHRSAREFGYDTSLWTLEMAAEASFEEGLTQRRVSGQTIRATLARLLGERWMRAKRWITSPDPLYERKASFASDRLMEVAEANSETWTVGFLDECWWSRVALPTLSSISEESKPLRLLQRSPKTIPSPKPSPATDPNVPEVDQRWLRLGEGRPISSITPQFLEWSCQKLEEIGKKVVVLIWDNASWHICREVRRWLGSHNREVKESGEGGRIVSCLLPKQSPWLNATEPKWVHGKRKVVESETHIPVHLTMSSRARTHGSAITFSSHSS
jgi:hypothetical protein